MSVILQLPRDILHCVYSEWLGWDDLSRLDIAYVEKNEREVWLTSLSDLKMTGKLEDHSLWGDKMTVFYKWLRSRKVYFVERFPLRLGVLDDLAVVLDMKSYCPTLRSVVIERGGGLLLPDRNQLESILSLFFSYCHNLRDITVCIVEEDILMCEALSEIVLGALEEGFKENSLVRFHLKGKHTYHRNQEVIARLLIKHASSLEELSVRMSDGMVLISSTLMQYGIHLRALNVNLTGKLWEPTLSWLLPYLLSAGRLLESLIVDFRGPIPDDLYDVLVPAVRLCSNLTTLFMRNIRLCRMESLYRLYTQCPHLQNVSIGRPFYIYDETSTMRIEVLTGNEVWLPCLSCVLARSRPERVILDHSDDVHDSSPDLKSLLEPYQIELESQACEESLIGLLRDLPHLNSFSLEHESGDESVYSDATLSAITEYAKNLTRLVVCFTHLDIFSDSCLRDLIERCQMLNSALVTCCGLDSLMALSTHSSLRVIEVIMAPSVSEEILDELLLDEEVKWSSILEEGSVELYENDDGIRYDFNKDGRRWMKNELFLEMVHLTAVE